ncbi:MAG: DUF4274 domain-containing protein [Blautia sp.]|nr:DUF4274 domain-containing protein [Blautia sp.]
MNDKTRISKLESWLYEYEDKDKIRAELAQTEDPEILYMYAYNYNWDDGFDIPQAILDHKKCELSTALLIFYMADGERYLSDKTDTGQESRWYSFVKDLHEAILAGRYQKGKIGFHAPLSKVQAYKLKKCLTMQENIFVEDIEGKNLDINV